MKTEVDPTKVLCRICGGEYISNLCLSVFSEAGIQQELQYKISQMLRIQVSPQGNMPKQICHMCLNRLDAAYELFKMCESVQDNIQYKVAGKAQINGNSTFLQDHHLTLLEEKCKSLTEYSPIMIGGSVLKLRHAPLQPEQSVPMNQIAQPVLGNQLSTMSQNQPVVVNQNSWLPQQPEAVPVQLGYTDMIPQPPQLNPIQYGPIQHNANQIQNGSQNNSTMNYYQHPTTAQQSSNTAGIQAGKEKVPRPMIGPKSKKVPRPIPLPPSRPSPLCKKPQRLNSTQTSTSPASNTTMKQCQFCKKNFSEDIIDHHVNLHLRKAFFTCIDCNKNFRTECGLEKHRCGKSEGDE